MGTGSYLRETVGTVYEQLYCGVAIPNPATDRVCLLRNGLSINNATAKSVFIAGEVAQAAGYTRSVPARQITAVSASTLTIPEHNLPNNTPVFLITQGGSVSGLSTGTRYFVVNGSASTIQLSLTPSGSAVSATSMSGTCFIRPSGSFDTTDVRFEAVWDPASFAASGGNIAYQGYFVLRGGAATANITVSSVNATSDEITTSANHGLATGDEVMFTTDSGTVPGGLTNTTIYFARAVNATTISLHPTQADAIANTNKVNILDTGSGTGPQRIRYANGYVDGFEYFGSAQNILDGRQQIIRIFRNTLNAGTLTGQA